MPTENNSIYYILPAFNEADNLEKLFSNFKNFYRNKKENVIIIYVNDGSTDNSVEKLQKIKIELPNNITLRILNHKINLGLGKALSNGFKECFSLAEDKEIFITMDTDNSHTVEQSYEMYKKVKENNFDMVIASRYRKNSKINGLNKLRIILSFVAAILFKIFFNIKNVRDYTCGFRAYKVDKIRKIIKNYDSFFSETGFSVSADILLKLYPHRKSFLISEEPLDLRYDLKKGKSKMRIFKTIFLTLKLLIVRKLFKY